MNRLLPCLCENVLFPAKHLQKKSALSQKAILDIVENLKVHLADHGGYLVVDMSIHWSMPETNILYGVNIFLSEHQACFVLLYVSGQNKKRVRLQKKLLRAFLDIERVGAPNHGEAQ